MSGISPHAPGGLSATVGSSLRDAGRLGGFARAAIAADASGASQRRASETRNRCALHLVRDLDHRRLVSSNAR
jgi:hypothetical protein